MKEKAYFINKAEYSFDDFLELMRLLRRPDGCPWDREQTHRSIRQNFLEETYEACDAIDQNDPAALREELGDVLMQVVFHAVIAEENGEFTIADVLNELCTKLVVRHPHVFGEIEAKDSDTVLTNWESIKNQTKGMSTLSDTLAGVAGALPALMRAQKFVSRTQKQSIDPESLMPDAVDDKTAIGRELFSVALRAKTAGIDAEEALEKYNKLYLERAKTAK